MPTLYVMETGARIELEHDRLLVTLEDETLLRVPLRRVSQVVLMGQVGATTPALHGLLRREIPLCFLSARGEFLGRLVGCAGLNLPLRKAQFERDADAGFCLRLARALTAGKIRNQYTLISRWLRRAGRGQAASEREALADLRRAVLSAGQAPDLDSLLGVEGSAANQYFDLYQSLFDPAWQFTGRNRRPPRDPINALLSLGYTLLHVNLVAALELVGLDPYLGFYHADDYGRPALALDLEEEFRAPVVDSLVYSLARHEQLRPGDFTGGPSGGSTWLKDTARREFVEQYSRKLRSTITTAATGRALAYLKHFEVQARGLARLISGEDAGPYLPFRAR